MISMPIGAWKAHASTAFVKPTNRQVTIPRLTDVISGENKNVPRLFH